SLYRNAWQAFGLPGQTRERYFPQPARARGGILRKHFAAQQSFSTASQQQSAASWTKRFRRRPMFRAIDRQARLRLIASFLVLGICRGPRVKPAEQAPAQTASSQQRKR